MRAFAVLTVLAPLLFRLVVPVTLHARVGRLYSTRHKLAAVTVAGPRCLVLALLLQALGHGATLVVAIGVVPSGVGRLGATSARFGATALVLVSFALAVPLTTYGSTIPQTLLTTVRLQTG